LGCLWNAALQLAEAPAAILEFAKDQRLPLPRYDTQSARHRALIPQHENQSITPHREAGTFLYLIAKATSPGQDEEMKITVLGLGNVGSQLARLWTAKGHMVTAGLREASKAAKTAKELGITVSDPAVAVKQADVIALALPWQAVEATLATLGPLDGRVLLDATNPLAADLSVLVPEESSGAEQIAQWARRARVVKAFNTIGAVLFGDSDFDMLYCGDDEEAKDAVRALIKDTTMSPVDAGPLRNARYLEQIAGLWIDLAVKGRIPGAFGFRLVRKT
jgi:8-hydroxy-5-deazaflavin:NADPH oxidoreductase